MMLYAWRCVAKHPVVFGGSRKTGTKLGNKRATSPGCSAGRARNLLIDWLAALDDFRNWLIREAA
jgi:hypothetical protein